MSNKGPIFTFKDATGQYKQNKRGSVVALKPLSTRDKQRQFDKNHKRLVRNVKAMLGLNPNLPLSKQRDALKNSKGIIKPWQPARQSKPWLNKTVWQKKKVDRFATQKAALKSWLSVTRFKAETPKEYFYATNTRRQATWLKAAGGRFNSLQQAALTQSVVAKPGGPLLREVSPLKKLPLTVYDKVFYYYTLQTPLTMYAHKAFILLEMQLNATLVRAKLVPYLFLVKDLCFYRLVQINAVIANNPHQVVSLYDSVSIPVYLHNYMYYRQYRTQHYPQNIGRFFKQYWAHFTNYTNNKVWLLSDFITSDITAETILFDHPNIALYMGPFKRFTKLYYKNHPYAPTANHRYLNHTHTVLKLKLFEYAAFYR